MVCRKPPSLAWIPMCKSIAFGMRSELVQMEDLSIWIGGNGVEVWYAVFDLYRGTLPS